MPLNANENTIKNDSIIEVRRLSWYSGILQLQYQLDTVTGPCDNDSVVSVFHGLKERYNEFR